MRTVGDLIRELEKYEATAPIIVDGPDSGGYDVTSCMDFEVTTLAHLYGKATNEPSVTALKAFPSAVVLRGIAEPDLWKASRDA